MALLALAVLILAMSGHSSATWCVCRQGLSDAVLQKTLDYACGAGADCTAIHQTGTCFQPNTVRDHCSYAVNSYFQKKGQAAGTCDFAGTAAISTTNPSASTCVYPSSASTAVTTTPTPVTTTPTTSTTPITGTPTTTTGTPTTTTGTPTTTTTSPYTATPTLGGVGTGLSPTGINTDMSHGGLRLQTFMPLFFLGLLVPLLN